jgi:lipopolysaccharide/colanic/teichoic acid biosynthesis glycosyltransferase
MRLWGKGNHRMLNQHTHPVPWHYAFVLKGALSLPTMLPWVAYPALKRWLDVLISIVLLILLAPLMLAIAIAIKLDSAGPILYVQRRGGLNGQLFNFYKFRSMTNGHDHTQEHRRFAEVYINSHTAPDQVGAAHSGFYKPATNGHAVTRVGRWLRRTSLDELPQLFNVLKGDMSLVGPRPSIDYEITLYTERHRQRLAVLPGLTGWAQINGRSSLQFDEIVTLDLEYIAQRSLRKDLSILLATVPAVLSARDAG